MHNYNELDNSECNMNLGKRQVYVHNIQSIVFHPTCPPCLKKTSTSHSFLVARHIAVRLLFSTSPTDLFMIGEVPQRFI